MAQVALYPQIDEEVNKFLRDLEEQDIEISKEAFCNLALAYFLADEEVVWKLARMAFLLELKGVAGQTQSHLQRRSCRERQSGERG